MMQRVSIIYRKRNPLTFYPHFKNEGNHETGTY